MRARCVSSPYTISTPYGNVPGYPLNNGFHTGTDYVSDGRILAPMDSKVTATGYDSVNGNYLVLEAPGYRDWFAHIKAGGYLVAVGQLVKRGQHIAWQGRTGSASGVHVHHSLRKNGVMVNPELHITEADMIGAEDIGPMRIVMSEVEGWNGRKVHAGEYDKIISEAWVGKPWETFITNGWVKQKTHRYMLEEKIAVLNKQVETLKAQIAAMESPTPLTKGIYEVK